MAFVVNWLWSWVRTPKEDVATPQEAIDKLNETMVILEKKQILLEEKIDEEVQNAKKLVTTNKKAALNALARKKRLEKQLGQIDGTLTTMECQKDALENAASNAEVMKAMQASAKSLKLVHQDMDIDKIHNIMDDVNEQQELSAEIANAMAMPIGTDVIDDDDLLAELLDLQSEEQSESDPSIHLPNAPTGDPAFMTPEKKRSKEEEELAALMEMN